MKYKVIFSKSYIVDADRELNAERAAREKMLEDEGSSFNVQIIKDRR